MADRPILFSGEMVRAILDGRKTQTRRVVKQKHLPFLANILDGFLDGKWNQRPTPYGKPGDTLWVRETWATFGGLNHLKPSKIHGTAVWYKDGTVIGNDYLQGNPGKWRPSIFMPRWASRITLRVTNVRVERVQDISDGDIVAEGIEDIGAKDSRAMFAFLWNSINAKRGYAWSDNPWVWVVEFEQVAP